MDVLTTIVSNGFILIVPIIVWNLILTAKLPPLYREQPFRKGKPIFVPAGEQIFRYIIFLTPLLMQTDVSATIGKAGLVCYIGGTVLYFLSWLPQLLKPDSRWCTSMAGFLAPAYTPLIWLAGISLMVDSYYFSLEYSPWHYLVPSFLFSIFHISIMYNVKKGRGQS